MGLDLGQVCDLLEKLEDLERAVPQLLPQIKRDKHDRAVAQFFRDQHNRINASSSTQVAVLSILLPDQRTDRVYGIRETRLKQILARSLGLGTSRMTGINQWTESSSDDFASTVSKVLEIHDVDIRTGPWEVERLDYTLHQIALMSRYTDRRSRQGRTTGVHYHEILEPFLKQHRSREVKWMLRLILKTIAPVSLDVNKLLPLISPLLPQIYRVQENFEQAIDVLNHPILVTGIKTYGPTSKIPTKLWEAALTPRLGTKIGRPTYYKARSLHHCLSLVEGSRWAAEAKYDGEYCQIHIDLTVGSRDRIHIFSKSGKNSTFDRIALHDAIRKSLRIGTRNCQFERNCILEGEMVVIDTRSGSIMDFSKIRKHVSRSGSSIGAQNDSMAHEYEKLGIIYYDALMIDDESTMLLGYEKRRQELKRLAGKSSGCHRLAQWSPYDFRQSSSRNHIFEEKLWRAFVRSITQRNEGMVLKPLDRPYLPFGDFRDDPNCGCVIKLKKDYLPGLGDSIDFALVGGSYNAHDSGYYNSRILKWTRFSIACLQNKHDVQTNEALPHFRIIATLLPQAVPEIWADMISQLGRFTARSYVNDEWNTHMTMNIEAGIDHPDSIFLSPFPVEVLGSSFEIPQNWTKYMLRHPRITKIHNDRSPHDCVSFDELQGLAQQALSRPENEVIEEQAWLKKLMKLSAPSRYVRDDCREPLSELGTSSVTSRNTTPRKTNSSSSCTNTTSLCQQKSPPSLLKRKTAPAQLVLPPVKRRVTDGESREDVVPKLPSIKASHKTDRPPPYVRPDSRDKQAQIQYLPTSGAANRSCRHMTCLPPEKTGNRRDGRHINVEAPCSDPGDSSEFLSCGDQSTIASSPDKSSNSDISSSLDDHRPFFTPPTEFANEMSDSTRPFAATATGAARGTHHGPRSQQADIGQPSEAYRARRKALLLAVGLPTDPPDTLCHTSPFFYHRFAIPQGLCRREDLERVCRKTFGIATTYLDSFKREPPHSDIYYMGHLLGESPLEANEIETLAVFYEIPVWRVVDENPSPDPFVAELQGICLGLNTRIEIWNPFVIPNLLVLHWDSRTGFYDREPSVEEVRKILTRGLTGEMTGQFDMNNKLESEGGDVYYWLRNRFVLFAADRSPDPRIVQRRDELIDDAISRMGIRRRSSDAL